MQGTPEVEKLMPSLRRMHNLDTTEKYNKVYSIVYGALKMPFTDVLLRDVHINAAIATMLKMINERDNKKTTEE